MPVLSKFFGGQSLLTQGMNTIRLIFMPGEYNAVFDIMTCKMSTGRMPLSKKRIIQAWIEIHLDELLLNWESIRTTGEYTQIAPLQ